MANVKALGCKECGRGPTHLFKTQNGIRIGGGATLRNIAGTYFCTDCKSVKLPSRRERRFKTKYKNLVNL